MPPTLLFIASDRREIEPWVTHWTGVQPLALPVHWARRGAWRGRTMLAIANGIGATRAEAAVQVARSLTALSGICSIGTAGALLPTLAIADIVVATAVTDGATTWTALKPGGSSVHFGLVRSSPHIAGTAEEKRKLHATGAIIVEMEAAGVACAARELAVPFYCVRTVSDLADETFSLDFESFLTPEGTFNLPRLILHAMAHPLTSFPELLRLQKRTALAAAQLSEFLATCDFSYD